MLYFVSPLLYDIVLKFSNFIGRKKLIWKDISYSYIDLLTFSTIYIFKKNSSNLRHKFWLFQKSQVKAPKCIENVFKSDWKQSI